MKLDAADIPALSKKISVGIDRAAAPDITTRAVWRGRHCVGIDVMVQSRPFNYVVRVAGLILDEAFGTEVWPKYPDIEQMLLDLGHPLA